MKRITGLVAAPFAPMNKNGELMTDRIPHYYNLLKQNGISAAFINGTTGEGPSLSRKERESVATAWAACSGSDKALEIINLVGGTSWRECSENAAFSNETGVSAIAVIAPYFFRPHDTGHLAEFFIRIGETIPEMPVYFYHIPSLTGVYHPMTEFLRLVTPALPNFAGIKYTHEDIEEYRSCLSFGEGRYDILWGRDEMLLEALKAGAKGAVGSTYNYAAPLYLEIIRKFMEGDHANAGRLQRKAVEMIELLGRYGGIGTGKAYMKYIDFDCGGFRLPVKNLSDDEYARFVADVESLGMSDYFSV